MAKIKSFILSFIAGIALLAYIFFKGKKSGTQETVAVHTKEKLEETNKIIETAQDAQQIKNDVSSRPADDVDELLSKYTRD